MFIIKKKLIFFIFYNKMKYLLLLVLFIIIMIVIILLISITYQSNNKEIHITYSKLGNNGRFGNQLFQIASVIGEANYRGYNYGFPTWNYIENFDQSLPVKNITGGRIPEKSPIKFENMNIRDNSDIDGYRQSEHYFSHNNFSILKQFKFKDSLLDRVRTKLNFKKDSKILGIHYRLGDYLTNIAHQVCKPEYYIAAINEFKSSRQIDQIIIFSDNPELAKKLIGIDCLVSPFDNEIDDFIGIMLCDYQILSNSSFSWWASYLSENSRIKSIYEYNAIAPWPWFNPDEVLGKYNEDCDIYRPCWKILDGKSGKPVRSNFEERIDYFDSLIKESIPKDIKIDPDLKVPVFIISMNQDRLSSAYQEASKAGLKHVNHFKAVVGKEQNYDKLVEYGIISKRFDHKAPENVSKTGTIGHLLSHFTIMQWMLKNNYDYIIVFEDDIVYKGDELEFKNVVKDSLEIIEDGWLGIQLGGCSSGCKDFVNIKDRLYTINKSYCTHAVIISRNGCQLLSGYLPIAEGIDTFINNSFTFDHKNNGLWYILHPSFFKQNVGLFGSSLRPRILYTGNEVECEKV
jgi:GR25 family glycosyltransferase involved in LPS biosynthesis